MSKLWISFYMFIASIFFGMQLSAFVSPASIKHPKVLSLLNIVGWGVIVIILLIVSNRKKVRPPTHPGECFFNDVVMGSAIHLKFSDLCTELSVSETTLCSFCAGKMSVNKHGLADKIAKFTNTTPASWRNMQDKWNKWKLEQ